jgi:hypothetical protein
VTGKFGGQCPQVDLVLLPEAYAANAMLLLMMRLAEADAESIMRLPGDPGIRRTAEMRELYPSSSAIGDAAPMRSDPPAVAWPYGLQRGSHT